MNMPEGVFVHSALKARVDEAVDEIDSRLRDIALKIHAEPELGHNEHRAVELLLQPLLEAGCEITHGLAGLKTAFMASHKGSADGPHIAFLAEYDALPEIGHACGHNIIGTAAVGALLAITKACPELAATISVIGTPAEETDGGKVTMAEHGVFDDIDAAMMIHPSDANILYSKIYACVDLLFRFRGRSAHASAAPEQGISALDAVITAFNAMNSLRQFVAEGSQIHGIITKGGDAPNIVPHYCEAAFTVRSTDVAGLHELKQKVCRAAEGAASSVGASFELEEGLVYADLRYNSELGGLFSQNMKALGIEMSLPEAVRASGSSDIGNVSQVTAAIHPYVQITETAGSHTPEFAQAAASEQAMVALNKSAKALAMTALDLVCEPEKLRRVRAEFESYK